MCKKSSTFAGCNMKRLIWIYGLLVCLLCACTSKNEVAYSTVHMLNFTVNSS